MATDTIKLEPVRMGSLTSASTSSTIGQKYLAPNKRSADNSGPVAINLGVDNFPTLGSAVKKLIGWGKHVVKVAPIPSVTATTSSEPPIVAGKETPRNMKDKIKEQILQAELEEQRPKEENPYRMTREELVADGWAVLSLNAEEVNKVRWRLNMPNSIASLSYED
jgi:hypothetical protein